MFSIARRLISYQVNHVPVDSMIRKNFYHFAISVRITVRIYVEIVARHVSRIIYFRLFHSVRSLKYRRRLYWHGIH